MQKHLVVARPIFFNEPIEEALVKHVTLQSGTKKLAIFGRFSLLKQSGIILRKIHYLINTNRNKHLFSLRK